jgi:molybdenum cofactor biosynthesis protein B
MSVKKHRKDSADARIRCAVITCSDTRTLDDDPSGDLIASLLEGAGHEIVSRQLVIEHPDAIKLALDAGRIDADAVILTGGTGLATRDRTPDVIEPLLDRKLPGFGELFRMLSFQEVGAAAMLSRAFAGVRERSVVFALPGSTAAVRLAMEKLILPELAHMVAQVQGATGPE